MRSPRPCSHSASSRVYDVAIIGGGFSGVMTAVHLIRLCSPKNSILLVERSNSLGRGLAYSTSTAEHLLNVPAKGMSAFLDEPNHFLCWLRENKNHDTSPGDFVSRQWYGEYVESILTEHLEQSPSPLVDCLFEEVVGIEQQDETLRLTMCGSSDSHARLVVLAVGNFPPADPPPLQDASTRRYVRYAWSPEALDGIADTDAILLIGSGLTAIDQVVTLESHGFKGTIYILSRRGLLPTMHAREVDWPMEWTQELPSEIRSLVREIRKQVEVAASRNVGWQAVIDSLRPVTQRLWKGMNLVERRRFLRHVRSFWEVHRHHVAPEVDQLVQKLRESGRLMLYAGRVLSCVDADRYAEVEYCNRRTREKGVLRVARILNCTGHETDGRKIDSPIVRSLFNRKLGRVDSSLQGLDVTDDGAIIDAMGRPSNILFAIGPARKGLLWESTAVPEIRSQAQRLAERIASQLAN